MSFRELALLLMCCVSCSIKESRDRCPCSLTLDVKAPGEVRVLMEGKDFLEDSTFPGDTSVTCLAPRPSVRVTSVCGAVWDGGVVIPEGEECPPLYLGVCRVDTDKETSRVDLPLCKSFCELEMKFQCPQGWKPLLLEIRGNVCGYGRDGRPMEGGFVCRPALSSTGLCKVRIPRQTDGSLVLDFGGGFVFALGKYIVESGYDWEKPDLEDIVMDVDISLTTITFHTGGWTRTEDLFYLI